MMAAQPIIGNGLVTTARTLVTIAVTKSTSRSSNNGNDTTVSENRISDSAAPSVQGRLATAPPYMVFVFPTPLGGRETGPAIPKWPP